MGLKVLKAKIKNQEVDNGISICKDGLLVMQNPILSGVHYTSYFIVLAQDFMYPFCLPENERKEFVWFLDVPIKFVCVLLPSIRASRPVCLKGNC